MAIPKYPRKSNRRLGEILSHLQPTVSTPDEGDQIETLVKAVPSPFEEGYNPLRSRGRFIQLAEEFGLTPEEGAELYDVYLQPNA